MNSQADEMKVKPHLLQKIIKIPPVMGRDWNAVWDLVDDVQLLKIAHQAPNEIFNPLTTSFLTRLANSNRVSKNTGCLKN